MHGLRQCFQRGVYIPRTLTFEKDTFHGPPDYPIKTTPTRNKVLNKALMDNGG